ncbi:hypothetical protein ATANTOWER_018878, partial [Ataeniobius toweri]|nr:hypothetical protein [Ataeniobius toweri]
MDCVKEPDTDLCTLRSQRMSMMNSNRRTANFIPSVICVWTSTNYISRHFNDRNQNGDLSW